MVTPGTDVFPINLSPKTVTTKAYSTLFPINTTRVTQIQKPQHTFHHPFLFCPQNTLHQIVPLPKLPFPKSSHESFSKFVSKFTRVVSNFLLFPNPKPPKNFKFTRSYFHSKYPYLNPFTLPSFSINKP